jgi:hypothetical protein
VYLSRSLLRFLRLQVGVSPADRNFEACVEGHARDDGGALAEAETGHASALREWARPTANLASRPSFTTATVLRDRWDMRGERGCTTTLREAWAAAKDARLIAPGPCASAGLHLVQHRNLTFPRSGNARNSPRGPDSDSPQRSQERGLATLMLEKISPAVVHACQRSSCFCLAAGA